jgi:hypothetical protein
MQRGLEALRQSSSNLSTEADSLTTNVEAMRRNFNEPLNCPKSPRLQ